MWRSISKVHSATFAVLEKAIKQKLKQTEIPALDINGVVAILKIIPVCVASIAQSVALALCTNCHQLSKNTFYFEAAYQQNLYSKSSVHKPYNLTI